MAQMDGEGKSEFGKSEPTKTGFGANLGPLHKLEVEFHEGGGHTLHLHPRVKPSKSGAFMIGEKSVSKGFSHGQKHELLSHVAQHLGIENADRENHDGENAE